MSGGKGGSQTTQVEIPQFIEDAAKQNLARAQATARMGYLPYYGPEVAAFSPLQTQAMQSAGTAGQAFGVWSFCAKFTLAVAAAFVLPILDWAGFSTIEINTGKALWTLTLLYAGLPCILKLGAVMMLSSNYLKEI